jgi:hypothetical protein
MVMSPGLVGRSRPPRGRRRGTGTRRRRRRRRLVEAPRWRWPLSTSNGKSPVGCTSPRERLVDGLQAELERQEGLLLEAEVAAAEERDAGRRRPPAARARWRSRPCSRSRRRRRGSARGPRTGPAPQLQYQKMSGNCSMSVAAGLGDLAGADDDHVDALRARSPISVSASACLDVVDDDRLGSNPFSSENSITPSTTPGSRRRRRGAGVAMPNTTCRHRWCRAS